MIPPGKKNIPRFRNLPPETKTSGPSFRDWGANSWWQNTRLTYWNMAPAGDFDEFATIMEFYLYSQ